MDAAGDAEKLRYFLDSVGSMVFMPAIRSEELWQVPAPASAAAPEHVAGLRAVADRAYGLVEEMSSMDHLTAHVPGSLPGIFPEPASLGPGQ